MKKGMKRLVEALSVSYAHTRAGEGLDYMFYASGLWRSSIAEVGFFGNSCVRVVDDVIFLLGQSLGELHAVIRAL
jgi:hypothetical protein